MQNVDYVTKLRASGRKEEEVTALVAANWVRHKQMLESIKGAPRNPATMGQPTP